MAVSLVLTAFPASADTPVVQTPNTITFIPREIAEASCVSIQGGPCVTACADGQWSSSDGPASCIGHGGEAR